MKSGGNEKRIQALFCELSLEDQSQAPRFEKLWSGAEVTRPAQVRRFSRSAVVIASALAITAASSLAAWSWYKSTQFPAQNAFNVPLQTPATILAVARVPEPYEMDSVIRPRRQRQKRSTRQRQTERALMREAAMLSSWQSPTQKFMESPTSFSLNSIPQLNQSVQELQLFLPKNNELMKESNQ
jgi:hypothetical protein